MWSILSSKIYFIYFLFWIAFALIEINIATNRWRSFKGWDLNSCFDDRNSDFPDPFSIYCEVLINCLELDVIVLMI